MSFAIVFFFAVVVTAVTELGNGKPRFYSTPDLIAFCRKWRLPTNHVWLFSTRWRAAFLLVILLTKSAFLPASQPIMFRYPANKPRHPHWVLQIALCKRVLVMVWLCCILILKVVSVASLDCSWIICQSRINILLILVLCLVCWWKNVYEL